MRASHSLFSRSPLDLAAIALVAAFMICPAARAQNIVDPSKVAPEFREAAEKRRAEQLKLIACTKAAQDAKIQPREIAKHVVDCFDKPDGEATDISAATKK